MATWARASGQREQRLTADALSNRERGTTAGDKPAMAATDIAFKRSRPPLYSVSNPGSQKGRGGMPGFNLEQIAAVRGRPHLGRRWDTAQVPPQPTQSASPTGPCHPSDSLEPMRMTPWASSSSLGAKTSGFPVSWIPHPGHKAEKCDRRASGQRRQLNSSRRPTAH